MKKMNKKKTLSIFRHRKKKKHEEPFRSVDTATVDKKDAKTLRRHDKLALKNYIRRRK